MNWFNNLRVAYKLALGFGICLFFALFAGVIAIQRLGVVDHASQKLSSVAVENTETVGSAINDIKQFRLWQVRYGISKDPSNIAACDNGLAKSEAAANLDVDKYVKAATDPEDVQNANLLKTKWKALVDATPRIRSVGLAGTQQQINTVISIETYPVAKDVTDHLTTMAAWNSKNGEKLAKAAHDAYLAARTQIIGFLLIAVVLGVGLAAYITKVIVSSLTQISNRVNSLDNICLHNLKGAVQGLAAGDLTVEIKTGTTHLDASSKDEFGDLGRGVNSMITKAQETIETFRESQKSLSKLIAQTNSAASTISTSSAELASGNEDLANRTSAQASNLEETAASMEEMTSIVKQNAENARLANGLAAEAKDVAENGGAIVERAVSSMDEINTSSKRIADIITVIDEIAFQTNLLALNAAVEAARVGEQGRGFAVVASEVRNLAGRSSTAAKEIKGLVQDSVRKVKDGTELVNQSGEQLRGIVSAVNRVAEIVADISAASQEQSAGIDQVNKAVIQMDEITQQNAALVEEATASSQAMSHRAAELQHLVSRFKFDDSLRYDVETAQRSVAQPRQIAARATGTNGVAPVATRRPSLRVVSSHTDDMEEF
ncbi:MAG TPA: methyl-accepting chemotaxis protein [Capsulimonadaceae bacterium]|jgi:methyl-accepting chemotaxis protein